MSERIQKQAAATERVPENVDAPTVSEKPDLSEIDDLLDEIDAVLEENAEEFVAQYIQKGGE